jgi:DNA-binding response OmpR family regulator
MSAATVATSSNTSSNTKRRVLVVDDEENVTHLVSSALRFDGFETVTADSGTAALVKVAESDPDLIVLDVMMPGLDGLGVLQNLRAAGSQVPVIFLTARDAANDRIVGLRAGADDYVVKPFSVRELLLRVQAVLRRSQPAQAAPAPPLPTPAITFGRLRIDREAPNVQVDDEDVSLTALELRLLCTLYERRNRVQSRAVLLDDVWCVSGENATRTVDTHVKRLREKLGPAGAYIETIRGIGYRFVGAPPKQPP